jgi:serine/threonine protein kinase
MAIHGIPAKPCRDSLPIHRRHEIILRDTINGVSAQRKEPTLVDEGASVDPQQLNVAASVKNTVKPPALESWELNIHTSRTDTTSNVRPERNTSIEPNPDYLRERINDICNANPIGLHPEGHYVPDKYLNEILNNETITDALGEGVDIALMEYILKKAPKTFATLQLVFSRPEDRKLAMRAFQISGFKDDVLESEKLVVCNPSQCRLLKQPQSTDSHVHELCSHFFPSKAPWDDIDLSHFKTHRWRFLVPTFNHKQLRYEFDSERLLPFKGRGNSKKDNSGNFSDVTCVDMLTNKQTMLPSPLSETIAVAHKTLRALPEASHYDILKEWSREAEAHKQLNGISDHLVRGIAAYRRIAKNRVNDTYHIVLEWADGGNFHTFLNRDIEPQLDGNIARSRDRVLQLLGQLHGLAQAVECMHTETTTFSRQNSGDLLMEQPSDLALTPMEELSVPIVNIEAPAEDSPVKAHYPDPTDPSSNSQDPSPPPLSPGLNGIDTKNWRHGDIKPENILRFTKGDSSIWLGTLKLADLGRAQQHKLVTAQRHTTEKERWRTRWYEPPDLCEDLHKQAHRKISRLFDIWSMGCVIFESVIWLLYGSSEITRFQQIDTPTAATPYWRKTSGGRYQLTERADLWMQHILKHDAKQASAIGDLVKLVRDRLLKIELPPDSDVYTPGKRTNAKDMREQLKSILDRASSEPRYRFDGIDKFGSHPPPGDLHTPTRPTAIFPNYLSVPPGGRSTDNPVPVGNRTRIVNERSYTDGIIEDWHYPDDHYFAERMIVDDQIPEDDRLCDDCKSIRIGMPELVFNKSSLDTNCEQCPLCELIIKATNRVDLPDDGQIRLTRDFDCFVANGSDNSMLKILRVCCTDQGNFKVGCVMPLLI